MVLPVAVLAFVVDPWRLGSPLWSLPDGGAVLGILSYGLVIWLLLALVPITMSSIWGQSDLWSKTWWHATVRCWLWIGFCVIVPTIQLEVLLADVGVPNTKLLLGTRAAVVAVAILLADFAMLFNPPKSHPPRLARS